MHEWPMPANHGHSGTQWGLGGYTSAGFRLRALVVVAPAAKRDAIAGDALLGELSQHTVRGRRFES